MIWIVWRNAPTMNVCLSLDQEQESVNLQPVKLYKEHQ